MKVETIKIVVLLPYLLQIPFPQAIVLLRVKVKKMWRILQDVNTTRTVVVHIIQSLCQVAVEMNTTHVGLWIMVSYLFCQLISWVIYFRIILGYSPDYAIFLMLLFFNILGSFYDKCISKNGIHYLRDDGTDGCYYFHSYNSLYMFTFEYNFRCYQGIRFYGQNILGFVK